MEQSRGGLTRSIGTLKTAGAWRLLAAAGMAALAGTPSAWTGPARAEPPPAIVFGTPSLLDKPPPKGPEAKGRPLAWPRLDPGALLCRTEADLARVAANRSGQGGGGAADCQVIRAATPVTIVQRKGPGRTQVMVTGQAGTGQGGGAGWTDVWLPEKPPSGSVAR
jgi:hypothetical protein